jgi:hypothetical protein
MSQSDCRDFRVYFNEFVYFSVSKVLQELEKHEVYKVETTQDVINRNIEIKKQNHLGAREQAEE